MKNETVQFNVQWEGPLSYENAEKLKNLSIDYGVYQIYGAHPVYGSNVLLYIGKANQHTFGEHLGREACNFHNQDSGQVTIYVGRLSGYKVPISNVAWSEQIALVERLLIYSHWPAGNTLGLNDAFDENLYDIHVLNWGKYRNLLPEISGARYSNRFSSVEEFTENDGSVQLTT